MVRSKLLLQFLRMLVSLLYMAYEHWQVQDNIFFNSFTAQWDKIWCIFYRTKSILQITSVWPWSWYVMKSTRNARHFSVPIYSVLANFLPWRIQYIKLKSVCESFIEISYCKYWRLYVLVSILWWWMFFIIQFGCHLRKYIFPLPLLPAIYSRTGEVLQIFYFSSYSIITLVPNHFAPNIKKFSKLYYLPLSLLLTLLHHA